MSTWQAYASFRIFAEDLDPMAVTNLLGIEPTLAFRRGERASRSAAPSRRGGWLLSTKDNASADLREQVDLLLDKIEPVAPEVAHLRNHGATADIFCYWATKDGQGGPQLDATQMRRLGALDLSISFDCYRV